MAGDLARGGEGYTKPSQYYPDNKKHGNYQFINLTDIINNFTAAYVGAGKILATTLSGDINYHAHRAIQELSYDTFKSCKTQEIVLPPSLQMILPHDYVNYTKITWSDANGIEHVIYPTSKTSNANTIQQDSDGNYVYAGGVGASEGNANLVQDQTPKDDVAGYALLNNFGYDPSTTSLATDYSGPFKLLANYEWYWEDQNGTLLSYSKKVDNPVLRDGMQIFHKGMQPNTTIKDVELIDEGNDVFATQFYINKPTEYLQMTQLGAEARFVTFDDISGSSTWGKYKSSGGSTDASSAHLHGSTSHVHYDEHTHGHHGNQFNARYGLDPQYAQSNGSFFIDCKSGKIHFSSNVAGKTIILHYLSDMIGDDMETMIPKLAEEAVYKWIAYGCASARVDVPENIIQRLRKEKIAETRKAKIRLSNIKIEEITQIMRGKGKFIQH